jgi:3-oxoacyl-[acyl-carrier protein] reductase
MFAEEGMHVAICARNAAHIEHAVRELAAETSGKVAGKAADVSNYEEVGQLFQFVDQQLGGLDVLVNNAGVGFFRPVADLSVDDWKRTVETNLYGAFYCSREALFRFGNSGGGHIVNISSLAGRHAFAGGAAYNASKFGMLGFSEAMMQDVRGANVRVSVVMPGSVATGFGAGAVSGEDWKIWPEDIADVVKMLLTMPDRTLISAVEVRPSRPGGAARK